MEIAKNTQRTKQIHRHLNLSPPCSPDREPPVFKDPFEIYETAQRAAGVGTSHQPATEEEANEIRELKGSGDEDTKMEVASDDEEEGSDEEDDDDDEE